MADPTTAAGDSIQAAPGSAIGAQRLSQTASEEDAWKKTCVLSLDGGGIRGYASLCVLQEFMDVIADIEQHHPGGSHKSSFLPIALDNEDLLPIREEPEEINDFTHPEQDASENLPEIEQGNQKQHGDARAVERLGSNDGDPQPVTTNGSITEVCRHRHRDPADPEQVADIEPAHRTESDEPGSTRLSGRVLSNVEPPSRQDTDMTEQRGAQNMEEATGFLPCHYFDYIAGTSTGGLNAIMLGRLRMRVEECIIRYPELAQSVFGRKRSRWTRFKHMSSTKYDSSRLETAVKDIVHTQVPADGKSPRQKEYQFLNFSSPTDLCKTVVVANKEGDQPTYIFRSYPHDGAEGEIKNPGPADDHPIWKVARATSAAPTFFDPIDIDGVLYSDGGVGSNNPVLLLIDEVISKSGLTGAGALVGAFDVLISIGTGQKPSKKLKAKHKHPSFSSWVSRRTLYRQISSIISDLKHAATDTEEKHLQIRKWSVDAGFRGYYRWTGGEEVGGLGLDEWNEEAKGNKPPTANFIEQKVKSYMAKDEIRRDVREAAQKLVDRRRARIADPSRNKYGEKYRGRFGRYSYCTLLRCPWCKHPKKTYVETEDALVKHVSSEHKDIKGDLFSRVGEFPHVPPRNPGGPH